MRKSLHFILFILCISNIYSQESTNLALLYNGYKDNQYKEIFIANNLPDNSTEEDVHIMIKMKRKYLLSMTS